MSEEQDKKWMQLALAEARKAWGKTSPNPMVGAVVVKNGENAGSGYHKKAGGPHAEVHALRNAGGAAEGADVYVTLEPCCTSGRTGPCTEALIKAGVKRVVIGCLDPNPYHAGRGMKILRNAGIDVKYGLEECDCRKLNEAFFKWITSGRPFVLLKTAATLDGKIATASGISKWITGSEARNCVQRMRMWSDAVMVGGETVRKDNPSLTVRTIKAWEDQPLKVVWSRKPDLFASSLKIFSGKNPPLFAAPNSSDEWDSFLLDLGKKSVTALLIEGGGELAASALRAGIVDKVAFFFAPKILGGKNSRSSVSGPDPASLDEAVTLCDMKTETFGNDILLTGYTKCSQD